MMERIKDMISVIKSGNYDNEMIHLEYDKLLEDFILHFDPNIYYAMKALIELKKDFWYA